MPMLFAAVARVFDTGVPAVPVTPRLRLAKAMFGVTVRVIDVAGKPSADAVIV